VRRKRKKYTGKPVGMLDVLGCFFMLAYIVYAYKYPVILPITIFILFMLNKLRNGYDKSQKPQRS